MMLKELVGAYLEFCRSVQRTDGRLQPVTRPGRDSDESRRLAVKNLLRAISVRADGLGILISRFIREILSWKQFRDKLNQLYATLGTK